MKITRNFAARIEDASAAAELLTNLGVNWKVISQGLQIREIEVEMPWELKRIVEKEMEDYFGDV